MASRVVEEVSAGTNVVLHWIHEFIRHGPETSSRMAQNMEVWERGKERLRASSGSMLSEGQSMRRVIEQWDQDAVDQCFETLKSMSDTTWSKVRWLAIRSRF